MAQIAVLAVSITAQTQKFNKGVNSALKTLTEFTAKTAAYGAAAAAAAAAGMAVFTRSAMQNIDATAKLSDSLGIATENMAGLQHAANLAGVGQETLTGALEKFTRELEPGKDVFQAFLDEADKIKELGNPVLQAAEAYDAFGKSGQKLLPLLLSGSDAIKEQVGDADKLGIAFDRIDAAKVEAANDAMTRLGALFDGLFIQLATQISPFITAAADGLVDMATKGESMGERVAGAFESVLTVLAKMADFFKLLEAVWYTFQSLIQSGVSAIVFGVKKAVEGMLDIAKKIPGVELMLDGDPVAALQDIEDMYFNAAEKADLKAGAAFDDFMTGKNQKGVTEFFDGIKKKAEDTAKAAADALAERMNATVTTDFSESFKDDTFVDMDAFDRANDELDEMKKKMEAAGEALRKEMLEPAEAFEEAQAEAVALLEAGVISQDTFNRKINALMEEHFPGGATGDVAEALKGGFREIDLSRVSIAGLAAGQQDKEQKIKAPVMEGLLKQIETNTKGVGKAR